MSPKKVGGTKVYEGGDVVLCKECGLPLCIHKRCINDECSEFYSHSCVETYRGRGDKKHPYPPKEEK